MVNVNLIIDGNYILMKNVFILKKLRALKDLEMLLNRDLDNTSKMFPFENVYFVSDTRGMNWRRQQYQEYKGTRKKDTDIDWEFVFETYENFKESIKNRNRIKLLEHQGLEGDDFIAHIVDTSNKKGFSNVLVASDGDLQQLLKMDLNENYINIQWNYRFSDERLYLPENYQLFLDKLENIETNDIFSLDNDTDFANFIETLIRKTKIKTVIPEQIIFEKIVSGDASDNIKSVIKVKDKLYNEEGRGIGATGAISVYKLYKEIHPGTIDIDSDTFISNLIDVVIYYKKLKKTDTFLVDKVRENIIFNRMLITLDTKYMPENVFENMNTHYNSVNDRINEEVVIDVEKQLEEDDFFAEDITPDIDEKFRIDEITDVVEDEKDEKFDVDDYWEI